MAKRGLWKMLAIVATFGLALALTGCGDNGGGGGPAFLGDTLNLTGQVYTFNWDTLRSVRYQGNHPTVSSWPQGGTGAIANGQFSFQMGRVNTEHLEELDDWLFYGATISPSSARGAGLELWVSGVGDLSRQNVTVRVSGNNETVTFDGVNFVFVDRDVTVSSGQVVENWDDNGFTETFTRRAFNISLQEGWNAVRFRGSNTWGPTGISGTTTISLGNPNVRWMLWEDDWYDIALSGDLESLDEAPARQGRGQFPPSRSRR